MSMPAWSRTSMNRRRLLRQTAALGLGWAAARSAETFLDPGAASAASDVEPFVRSDDPHCSPLLPRCEGTLTDTRTPAAVSSSATIILRRLPYGARFLVGAQCSQRRMPQAIGETFRVLHVDDQGRP